MWVKDGCVKGISDYLSKCARICLHKQRASDRLSRFAVLQSAETMELRHAGRESQFHGLFEDVQRLGQGAHEKGLNPI